ncbi:Hypothetical protein SMAX5B_019133 [Scophthalmus maximus]|uniref:Uncharacterized protein n=1 Tax=Scophthalmus maximus TaxID=52904 RepID=A0A2U9C559_SCOMX|nr:Hypothetical protein SMAX5B_019133 [Scophthalmus maximus]KAF0040013.1 hypothetical protein F2P81_008248 [Scophthalmus maximus]
MAILEEQHVGSLGHVRRGPTITPTQLLCAGQFRRPHIDSERGLSNLPPAALRRGLILQSPESCLLGTGSESESAVDRHTLMTPIWLFFKYSHPIKLALIDQPALPLDGGHGDNKSPAAPSARIGF